MKVKKLMAAALVGSMALSLAACGGDTTTTEENPSGETTAESTEAGDGSYNISVILKTTASEYWGYVKAGAEAYGKEHPEVTVSVKGASSETAYEEQLNMIDTELNNAANDGFVIAPLQADMVKNLVAGQTKPIAAVDTDIDAPEVFTFVGTGNEEAGKLGGAAAVEAAKAAGWTDIKAIEIAGVQGDATNEARMAGYKAGIEENGGDFLEEEVQYADATADKAVNSMEAIMQTHPEGIAIICANNDDMAMAAARTAKSNPAYANTIFLGFDAIQAGCQSIVDGELTMSVAQQGYEMGYMAVEAVVDKLNGATDIEDFIDSGASVVDSSNAQERMDTLKGYLGE